jgi:hypothetical protein
MNAWLENLDAFVMPRPFLNAAHATAKCRARKLDAWLKLVDAWLETSMHS